jgi:hypothetical protein
MRGSATIQKKNGCDPPGRKGKKGSWLMMMLSNEILDLVVVVVKLRVVTVVKP